MSKFNFIIPAPIQLLAIAILSALSLLLVVFQHLQWISIGTTNVLWWVALLVLVMICLFDFALAWSSPKPNALRRTPAAFSVQKHHSIELIFDSADLKNGMLVADEHPGDDGNTGLPTHVTASDLNTTVVSYRYRPSQRGKAEFGQILIWQRSPLKLWQRRCRVGEPTSVPVFPDFSMLSREQLQAQDKSTQEFGQRVQIKRGEGMEFHQLREYRPGDSLRQIDWKASARRRSLISREYQEEENQQIIVLLDGGQRLAMRVDELTGFDHALNASLMLAWNAVREGDRPGALVFSGDEPCWVPPRRGRDNINAMLHALYPMHPSDMASDYSEAAQQLLKHQHHHALVVLITQLQPDDENDLLDAVRTLQHKFRLMVVDVQLPEQHDVSHMTPESMDDAMLVLGDAAWNSQRHALHIRLRHAGVMLVQSTPHKLSSALNQAYLSMKQAGIL